MLGIIAVLNKIKLLPFRVLLRGACMVEQNLTSPFCIHNSSSFDKIQTTTEPPWCFTHDCRWSMSYVSPDLLHIIRPATSSFVLYLSSFINVFKDTLYNKARHHLVGTDIQFYVCHTALYLVFFIDWTDKKWTNNVFLRQAAKKIKIKNAWRYNFKLVIC